MEYNTQKEKILLSEYGRNIQKLVDHAITIENPETRALAAKQIIKAMGILNPKIHSILDYKNILWNQLAYMSDYKLDIEYPYPITKEEELNIKPKHVGYNNTRIKYKHFGRIIEKLVEKVSSIEDKEIKERYVILITNHLKKTYLTWNKEVVQDEVIFEALDHISNGELKPEKGYTLPRARDIKSKTRNRSKKNRK